MVRLIKVEVNADSTSNEEILDIIKSLQQSQDKLKAEVTLLKAENDTLKEDVRSCNVKMNSVQNYLTEYNHITNDIGSVKNAGPLDPMKQSDRSTGQDRDKRVLMHGDPISYPRYAFSAYLGHILKHIGPEQIIVYNQVLLNEGGAYNNVSGIFTVPVSGIYFFSWSSVASKDPSKAGYDVWISLMVNSNRLTTAVAQTNSEWDDNQGSNVAIVHANKGDVIFTEHYGGLTLFGDSGRRVTTFSGVLLYLD